MEKKEETLTPNIDVGRLLGDSIRNAFHRGMDMSKTEEGTPFFIDMVYSLGTLIHVCNLGIGTSLVFGTIGALCDIATRTPLTLKQYRDTVEQLTNMNSVDFAELCVCLTTKLSKEPPASKSSIKLQQDIVTLEMQIKVIGRSAQKNSEGREKLEDVILLRSKQRELLLEYFTQVKNNGKATQIHINDIIENFPRYVSDRPECQGFTP